MEILSKKIYKEEPSRNFSTETCNNKLKKQPTMHRLNSKMERTGSRISELEDRTIKITLYKIEKRDFKK